jgi:hypothetical protein
MCMPTDRLRQLLNEIKTGIETIPLETKEKAEFRALIEKILALLE